VRKKGSGGNAEEAVVRKLWGKAPRVKAENGHEKSKKTKKLPLSRKWEETFTEKLEAGLRIVLVTGRCIKRSGAWKGPLGSVDRAFIFPGVAEKIAKEDISKNR